MTEIKVPATAGAGMTSSIGRWFKRVGDPVTAQEPLVEIVTDGVTHELRAPATGVLSKVSIKDGQSVGPGALLGVIDQV